MISATIEVTKDEWTPALNAYRKQWQNLSPLDYRISAIVRESIRQNYLTQGAHSGQPWPPRKRYYPWRPLIKTGRMMSMQQAAAAGHFSRLGSTHTMSWSHVLDVTKYSRKQHTGTRFMASRPTLALSHAKVDEIHNLVSEYLLVLEYHTYEK